MASSVGLARMKGSERVGVIPLGMDFVLTVQYLGRVNLAEVIGVSCRVVTGNFDDFGNKPASWSAFELEDDVERIADVVLDGAIRELDATL